MNQDTMDQAIDTIHALRRQEEHYYYASSYCYPEERSAVPDWDCRQKMAAWCAQVIQFCNLGHETAEIAIAMLDCFLATRGGESARTCRDQFRLACMACLYAAIKNTETQALHSKTFSELSQGEYSVKDIEKAELSVLTWLQWRVNPPTAMAFVRELMHLLPASFDDTNRRDLYDLTVLQIERAFGAVVASPSAVAYAAFMNSLALVCEGAECLSHISRIMAGALKVDRTSDAILDTQASLFHFLPKQVTFVSSGVYAKGDRSRNKSPVGYVYDSPRSVTE